MRVSIKELESLVDRVNTLTNNPSKPWTRVDNRSVANIGNYHLSGAYGGYCLHQVCTDGGGVNSVFNCGYVSKRELADRIRAFICGINVNIEAK